MTILSNGGNPDNKHEMTKRVCILRDMYVHIGGWGGLEEFYRVNSEGIERGEALLSGQWDGAVFRVYVCGNCGMEWDGNTKDADVKLKEHIGKKHPYLHPFNLVLRGSEL